MDKKSNFLTITPEKEIIFQFVPNQDIQQNIKLENSSDNFITFKIKTTAERLRFGVKPGVGLIPPHSITHIEIVFHRLTSTPSNIVENTVWTDRFQIQYLPLNNVSDMNHKDVLKIWKEIDQNKGKRQIPCLKNIITSKVIFNPTVNESNNKNGELNDFVESLIASANDETDQPPNDQSDNLAPPVNRNKSSLSNFTNNDNAMNNESNSTSLPSPANTNVNFNIKKTPTPSPLPEIDSESYLTLIQKANDHDKILNHTITLASEISLYKDIVESQKKQIEELSSHVSNLSSEIKKKEYTKQKERHALETSSEFQLQESGFRTWHIILVAVLCLIIGKFI